MNITHFAIALSGAFAFDSYAQSPVTIYGNIDGGIRNVTNVSAGGDQLRMNSNGEFYNNRLGFKGSEDLGNGLNAHFQLETGWNMGTGDLDTPQRRPFNRYSIVGIDGAFGTIDIGRMPSLSCKLISLYEPFQYHYVQMIPLAGASAGNADGNTPGNPFGTMGGTRLSNDIQYIGKFNGFIIGAEYSFGEAVGSAKSGASKAVALGYNNGAFAIGAVYTKQSPNVSASGPAIYRDQNQITFGAAYQIGDVRLSGGYIKTKTDAIMPTIQHAAKNLWLGASYNVTTAIGLTFGYYRTTLETAEKELARRNFAILGATYALSKRTTLYADVDHAELTGIAALAAGGQTSQVGISMGINHSF